MFEESRVKHAAVSVVFIFHKSDKTKLKRLEAIWNKCSQPAHPLV